MIKIVKLMTGEEVIAEMSMEDSSIKLVKPFVLQIAPNNAPDNKGEVGLALFPYAPYVLDHVITVDAAKVLWIAELPESMKLDYNRALSALSVSMKTIEETLAKGTT
jgi:hypothetical protein